MTVDWLMYGIGKPPELHGQVYQPHTTLLNKSRLLAEAERMHQAIEAFTQTAYQPLTVTLADDTLEPLYHLGDILGGSCIPASQFTLMDGQIAIVKTSQEDILARKLILSTEQNHLFHLYSTNPNSKTHTPVLTHQELIAVAPITRIWRMPGIYSS